MKGFSGLSVNELIGLTVLALMVIALIGAQAGAAATAPPASATVAAEPEGPAGPDRLRLAVTIDVDLESLGILFAIGEPDAAAGGRFEAAVGRPD